MGPGLAAALVASMAVADLARAGAGLNPQVAVSFHEPLPEMTALRLDALGEERVFSYGVDHSPAFRAFLSRGGPGRTLAGTWVNRQILAPYSNVADRVETPEAKDLTSFVPRARELGPEDYAPGAVARLLPWLRNASVARVLSLDPLEHPDLHLLATIPVGLPGLDLHVYRLAAPWPRAYVACRTVDGGGEPIMAPYRPGFEPGRDVALAGGASPTCGEGEARRASFAAGRERYEVTADGTGYLVTRDSYARGWRARVDGVEAPVLRANGKHRAVPLPEGAGEVVLEYHPPGLARGPGPERALPPRRPGGCGSRCRGGAGRERRRLGSASRSRVPPAASPLAMGEDGGRCAACGARYPVESGILRLTLGREGAPGYDPHFFDTLERIEDRHFWFVSRRNVILDALRRAVPDLEGQGLFDIGCGSGGLVEHLATHGVSVVGACDAYVESLEIVRRRLAAPLVLVDEGRLPPLAPGHRLLALFDVLEHLDDDRGMLRFLHEILVPGGGLVLTVPAHPFLFDDRDELAHHRRRYRRPRAAARSSPRPASRSGCSPTSWRPSFPRSWWGGGSPGSCRRPCGAGGRGRTSSSVSCPG